MREDPRSHDARLATPEPERIHFIAAWRELGRVHRIEQARLLREACRLRSARHGIDGVRQGSWRVEAQEELATGRADGCAGSELLRQLLALPVGAWPPARALGLAALALEPCDAGRLEIARADLASGRARATVRGLVALLVRGPTESARAQAMEILAQALLALGDPRSALAWTAAAAREPRSGLEPVVGALALALRCGDERQARSAAFRLQRLDLSVVGSARRFRSSLRRWRSRLVPGSADGPILPDGRGRALARELARSSAGAPAHVARALLR